MENNPNNKNSLSETNRSILFSQGSSGSSEYRPVNLHKKRQQFANEIRQEQRENKRRQMRYEYMAFLKNIGISDLHTNENKELDQCLIEQENDKIYAELFFQSFSQIDKDEDEYSENFLKTQRIINKYCEKNLEDDPAYLWQMILNRVTQLLKSKPLQSSNFRLNLSEMSKDFQVVVWILCKQLYYKDANWSITRVIDPKHYLIISQWIYTVCKMCQSQIGNELKEIINVLIDLLILFNLKIEAMNCLIRQNSTIQNEQAWNDSYLLGKIMTEFPCNFSKWGILSMSNGFEQKIYTAFIISDLIMKKSSQLLETFKNSESQNKQNSESQHKTYETIIQIKNLLNSIKKFTLHLKLSDESITTQFFSNEEKLNKIELLLIFTSQIQKSLESLIVSLHGVFDFFSQKNQIVFEFYTICVEVIKLYCQVQDYFVNVQSNYTSFNRNNDGLEFRDSMDIKFQDMLQSFMKKNRPKLKSNSLIKQQLDGRLKAGKQKFNSNDLESLNISITSSFVVEKLQDFNSLLELIIEILINPVSNPKIKESKEEWNQAAENIFCSMVLKNMQVFLKNRLFNKYIFSEQTYIKSVWDIKATADIQQYGANVEFYLLILIEQLFFIFQHKCFALQKIKLTERNQESMKIETILIGQVWDIIKLLNTVSEKSGTNVFKYGCLMWEFARKKSIDQGQRISIFQLISFVYSHLSRLKCKNNTEWLMKFEVSMFCQSIVYYFFPIQTYLSQVVQMSREKTLQVADQLISLSRKYKKSLKGKSNNEEEKNLFPLEKVFTSEYLDNQTEFLLQLIKIFMEQHLPDVNINALNTLTTLLLAANDHLAFNYFANHIRSSDLKIYCEAQRLLQNSEHQRVVEAAQQFLETIENGFQEDIGDTNHPNNTQEIQI